MALRRNTFDGGTAGTGVTVASSSSSGDPFTATESSNLTYSTAAATHGGMGAISNSSASLAHVRCSITGSKNVAAAEHVRVNPAATSDVHILQFGTGGSSFVRVASIHVNGENKLRLSDATGTAPGVWTATDALDAAKTYLVEMYAAVGTTTANGALTVSYREVGATSAIETSTVSSLDLGTVNLTDINFGRRTVVANVVSIDEVRWDDAATGVLGPLVDPPTIDIDTTTAVAMVDARGSTGAGTLTYSIAPSTGVTEPVDGLFLIPQATSPVDYTITVTQSGVGYTQVVSVPAAGVGDTRPSIFVLTAGGWS